MNDRSNLLTVKNLKKYFPIYEGIIKKQISAVHAVDDVSFKIDESQTFSLVGESGCGKSTTGRLILKLIPADSGEINFSGNNIIKLNKSETRNLRNQMQIIFQDPYASLNPRISIGKSIEEPLLIHNFGDKKERENRTFELLELVGLDQKDSIKYPHQFSGGQRQRIGIARALALNPKLIVCDEPVSALDVSIRAQILNLLLDLQDKLGLSYLFISHDLSVVRYISSIVAVMYLGKIVEVAAVDSFFNEPHHPYSEALLSAIPAPDPSKEKTRKRIVLEGDVPSPINPPSGCRFHTRCPIAQEICNEQEPELKEHATNHKAACHFAKPRPIASN